MQLTAKQKRILRWVGYPLVGVIAFIAALHLTFPYSRIVDKFVVESLSDKYEVSYTSVERGFLPGSVTVRGLSMRSHDTGNEDGLGATNLYFKEVQLKLGLMALIGGSADVEFSARLGGGSIEGHIQASATELAVEIDTSSLPLAGLGGVQESVGLPMDGGLNASVNLTIPDHRYDKMNGRITLSCPGCTIGDGETKLKPREIPGRRARRSTAVFAKEGLTVPQLALGDLGGTMVIEDGRGKIDDFSANSEDGEMALYASLRFTRDIGKTRFESGCMKFRLSDSLKKRDPKFGTVPQFMQISPEPDGFSNVKLKGLLKAMRWVPSKSCDAGGGQEIGDRASRTAARRPTLTPKANDKDDQAEAPKRPDLSTRLEEKKNQALDETPQPTLPEPRTSGPPLTRPTSGDDVGPRRGLQKVTSDDDANGEASDGQDGDGDDQGDGDGDGQGDGDGDGDDQGDGDGDGQGDGDGDGDDEGDDEGEDDADDGDDGDGDGE